jgi:hypothetical protein
MRWHSVFPGSIAVSLALLATAGAARGADATASFEPKADRLLRQMSEHLSEFQAFKVKAQSTTQEVIKGGERLSHLAASGAEGRGRRRHVMKRYGSDLWKCTVLLADLIASD